MEDEESSSSSSSSEEDEDSSSSSSSSSSHLASRNELREELHQLCSLFMARSRVILLLCDPQHSANILKTMRKACTILHVGILTLTCSLPSILA